MVLQLKEIKLRGVWMSNDLWLTKLRACQLINSWRFLMTRFLIWQRMRRKETATRRRHPNHWWRCEKDQVVAALTSLTKSAHGQKAIFPDCLEHFRYFDKNGNGVLDITELRCLNMLDLAILSPRNLQLDFYSGTTRTQKMEFSAWMK